MKRSHHTATLIALLTALTLLMSACKASAPGGTSPAPVTPGTATTVSTRTPAASQTLPAPSETIPAVTVQPQSTAIPSAAPTRDLRLDPADWREWPVVPERVSDFAIQVYQQGLAAGNDPHAFSKVGDCQAIREVLMGLYDKPGYYKLQEGYDYLQQTIDQFSGSFNRDGQGVKGGYNAAAVLSPLWADPQVCQPGETPIECEYRIHKPGIVIISLEVWWDGRTPERYEQYMRKIIDFYLAHGVVPVLSTKADNVEGDHAINRITAELAYEYDLPLWNWWRAVQDLPGHGLQEDGSHLTFGGPFFGNPANLRKAWPVRNLNALEVLKVVMENR
jgi:hypothetical protein